MSFISRFGIVFAKQWIAGTTIDDAILAAKELNEGGQRVTLNYLGEGVRNRRRVGQDVRIYLNLLDAMKKARIRGDISLKATELGLVVGRELFYRNYREISLHARRRGIFVWLDMEEYEYVDDTIGSYLRLLRETRNIGICIQTKLKRSYDDVKRIAGKGGIVRLVKGAYTEPIDRAYSTPRAVRGNFLIMMNYLFRHSKRFMVATHDDKILHDALEQEKRHHANLIFGLLKGVRGNLAKKLTEEGEEVNLYVPFGEDWIGYSMRRLREEGHAVLILRSVFQQ